MTQKMIRKRDGRLVEFHTEKIRNAIWRSFLGVGQTGMEDVSDALARKVETMLELEGCEPEVEHVQDLVEQVLMQEGYGRTAKAYILYRAVRLLCGAAGGKFLRAADIALHAAEGSLELRRLGIVIGLLPGKRRSQALFGQ